MHAFDLRCFDAIWALQPLGGLYRLDEQWLEMKIAPSLAGSQRLPMEPAGQGVLVWTILSVSLSVGERVNMDTSPVLLATC